MLEVDDLHVSIAGTPVLKGVSLRIRPGETFILFGPNGSGKTTLLMTLMGFSGYTVTRGTIRFKGEDITNAPMYERARLGMGMSFQRPPTIHGLPVRNLLTMCARNNPDRDFTPLAQQVNFERFLDRDVNAGFSGGEIKRSEMLQLMAQEPDLLLFDEPESGVDLENMAVIGKAARTLLSGSSGERCSGCAGKHAPGKARNTNKAGLIITHTGYILEYVNADRGQVMYEGHLCCEARPRDILEHVRQHGYQECLRCFMDERELRVLHKKTQGESRV